jgi:hypothetical protein
MLLFLLVGGQLVADLIGCQATVFLFGVFVIPRPFLSGVVVHTLFALRVAFSGLLLRFRGIVASMLSIVPCLVEQTLRMRFHIGRNLKQLLRRSIHRLFAIDGA